MRCCVGVGLVSFALYYTFDNIYLDSDPLHSQLNGDLRIHSLIVDCSIETLNTECAHMRRRTGKRVECLGVLIHSVKDLPCSFYHQKFFGCG